MITSKYITSIIQRFDMFYSKPISTPLTFPCKLSKDDSSKMKDVPYKTILRCITYLVSCTHLNICFITGFRSRFMPANPRPKN